MKIMMKALLLVLVVCFSVSSRATKPEGNDHQNAAKYLQSHPNEFLDELLYEVERRLQAITEEAVEFSREKVSYGNEAYGLSNGYFLRVDNAGETQFYYGVAQATDSEGRPYLKLSFLQPIKGKKEIAELVLVRDIENFLQKSSVGGESFDFKDWYSQLTDEFKVLKPDASFPRYLSKRIDELLTLKPGYTKYPSFMLADNKMEETQARAKKANLKSEVQNLQIQIDKERSYLRFLAFAEIVPFAAEGFSVFKMLDSFQKFENVSMIQSGVLLVVSVWAMLWLYEQMKDSVVKINNHGYRLSSLKEKISQLERIIASRNIWKSKLSKRSCKIATL